MSEIILFNFYPKFLCNFTQLICVFCLQYLESFLVHYFKVVKKESFNFCVVFQFIIHHTSNYSISQLSSNFNLFARTISVANISMLTVVNCKLRSNTFITLGITASSSGPPSINTSFARILPKS